MRYLDDGSCVNRTNSLTLKIWCNMCLNKLRKKWLRKPHHEVMFNKTWYRWYGLTNLLGRTGPKDHVELDDWCSDFLIINWSFDRPVSQNLTVFLWPLLCLYTCKFQHLLYNLATSCAHSGFTSHLIVWLRYAVGVSAGSNWTRCWQRQTASPAAGPYSFCRAPSLSPGPAPYTRTVHSPVPEGEREEQGGTKVCQHILNLQSLHEKEFSQKKTKRQRR